MLVRAEDTLFSEPRTGLKASDCDFYHVMDLPGHGRTPGQWDLRAGADDYLGGLPLAGKRVLEIGPASGFLTFEMERRGAEVVCFDVSDEIGWNFVPQPASVSDATAAGMRKHLVRIKNSWWFARAAYEGKARICYGNVYDLPSGLGEFDVAVLAAVLLHTRSPARILEQCGQRCKAIVITEPHDARIDDEPVCRFHPTAQNQDISTWWTISPLFCRNMLEVMGYEVSKPVFHRQSYHGQSNPMYTIVGTRRA